MNNGNASKAISYLAVDYEDCINDALSDENVNEIVKHETVKILDNKGNVKAERIN